MRFFDYLFGRETEIPPAENPENKPVEIQQKPSAQEWRYGVAGNITKTHYDEQGVLRYGSSAFCGGAKVYLCGKNWEKGQGKIGVIGLDRCKRIAFTDVQPELIENVRGTKVYKPSVLNLMGEHEYSEAWWDNTPAAKKDIARFLKMWNEG